MRLALLALAAFGGAAPRAEIEWWDDLRVAREEAARAGKPLFVVFRCEP